MHVQRKDYGNLTEGKMVYLIGMNLIYMYMHYINLYRFLNVYSLWMYLRMYLLANADI